MLEVALRLLSFSALPDEFPWLGTVLFSSLGVPPLVTLAPSCTVECCLVGDGGEAAGVGDRELEGGDLSVLPEPGNLFPFWFSFAGPSEKWSFIPALCANFGGACREIQICKQGQDRTFKGIHTMNSKEDVLSRVLSHYPHKSLYSGNYLVVITHLAQD